MHQSNHLEVVSVQGNDTARSVFGGEQELTDHALREVYAFSDAARIAILVVANGWLINLSHVKRSMDFNNVWLNAPGRAQS